MQHGCYNISTYQPTKARFAMDRLQFGVQEGSVEPISAPPHTLIQEDGSYSVLFNMYGVPESKIKFGLDFEKRRLTVFAEKEAKTFTDQFLWVFALPNKADLNSLETHYKKGVVEFRFQKRLSKLASVV